MASAMIVSGSAHYIAFECTGRQAIAQSLCHRLTVRTRMEIC